ncbi:MAG: hypothetical protein AAFR22_11115, partial [Chloroflexota bacterium]
PLVIFFPSIAYPRYFQVVIDETCGEDYHVIDRSYYDSDSASYDSPQVTCELIDTLPMEAECVCHPRPIE